MHSAICHEPAKRGGCKHVYQGFHRTPPPPPTESLSSVLASLPCSHPFTPHTRRSSVALPVSRLTVMPHHWNLIVEGLSVVTVLLLVAVVTFFICLRLLRPAEVQRRYTFHESTTILSGQSTRLQFVSLAPQNTSFNSTPTILRRFMNDTMYETVSISEF